MQCCNKHVIIYSGARVSELIRAIRSFVSIDFSYFKFSIAKHAYNSVGASSGDIKEIKKNWQERGEKRQ